HVVADGHLVADAGRVGPPLDVDHGEVLDIGAPPDADGVHVTAEDGVVPDRRFLPDLHVPDDLGAVGDENRRMKAWGDSLEEADRHQAASSGRRGGTGGRSTSATSVPERALGGARSRPGRSGAVEVHRPVVRSPPEATFWVGAGGSLDQNLHLLAHQLAGDLRPDAALHGLEPLQTLDLHLMWNRSPDGLLEAGHG